MNRTDAHAYDRIGVGYQACRRPDPRLFDCIAKALGDADRVLNVGAGTGNYEPETGMVVALEPSDLMIRQRRNRPAAVVRGVAERLPFRDASFDASLAIFTVHHWADVPAALVELQRVSRRQIILAHDRSLSSCYWLAEYFPEMLTLTSEKSAGFEELKQWLRLVRTDVVPIPIDCTDGFLSAFWGRPEAVLDPAVRVGSSALSQLAPEVAARNCGRLRDDLASGVWDARYGFLRELREFDMGFRLLVCGE